MHVTVDLAVCQGYAQCVQAVPEVFELREDERLHAVVVNPEPDESLRERLELAVQLCPMQAITIDG